MPYVQCDGTGMLGRTLINRLRFYCHIDVICAYCYYTWDIEGMSYLE